MNQKLKVLFSGFFGVISLLYQDAENEKPDDPETSSDVLDEIIVEADPYLKNLKGRLADAFGAFRAGDYVAAEQEFLALKDTVSRNYLRMAVGSGGFSIESRIVIDAIHKDEGIIFYMYGLSLARQSKFEDAMDPLRKAWRINPRHYQARLDYALVSVLADKPRKAKWQLIKVRGRARKCDNECPDFAASVARLETLYAEAMERQTKARAEK